ncbi:MAG: hypothetical protein H6858_04450 [Rhodospirillales bacterium]|nr:hypothetical protein [Alphaproteobacteria bacterium]MCB1840510.1 hypothetical protein [Alphaproteobacteria bacterium]MCB9976836.1 hypothetical protein [Rhodospirillales bacterium]
MTTVDVERLQFVDVRESTRGNFMDTETLDRFLDSEVGKAQEKLMREQMEAQGFPAEDITTSMIRRSLITEQCSQDANYRTADLTTKQLMDLKGPDWLDRLGSLITNFGRAGDQAVRDGATAGAAMVVDGVTTNSGLTGQAADALTSRTTVLENLLKK